MEVIRIKKETDSSGNLALNIPTEQKNRTVDVLVVITNEETTAKKPSMEEFFGKLKWKGNALEEQRKLRNEWS